MDGSRLLRPGRILVGAWLAAMTFGFVAAPSLDGRQALINWTREFYTRRTSALQTGDTKSLESFYGHGSPARRAWHHEIKRLEHLHAWLETRHAKLLSLTPNLRLIHPEPEGDSRATVHVTLTTLLAYSYPGPGEPENTFGFTTYHLLRLDRSGGSWTVAAEWYEDPLCEDSLQSVLVPTEIRRSKMYERITPLREAVSRYADRYCGVVVSGISDGRYNRRYPDLTFRGGDCASFVSQALTDREAGRIQRDWSWWCGELSATVTWARADSLVQHLLANNLAAILDEGTLPHLVSSGRLAEIRPGDIIAYREGGRICHVSLVVARDSRGWPLVDSHTADRYHTPFDLGWDRNFTYLLLQTALP